MIITHITITKTRRVKTVLRNDMPKPLTVKFECRSSLSEEQFKQLTCIVPISVGQAYHEGEAFEITMRKAYSSFGRVVIIIADSLQRWTMAIPQDGVNPETLRDEANRLGKEWLERNKKAIEILQDKLAGIIHWDSIMQSHEGQKELEKLRSFYQDGIASSKKPKEERESSVNFYERVELSVKSTYGKKHRATTGYDPQSRFADMSREYILEESAAFCLFQHIGKFLNDPQMQHLEGNVLVYPARLNQAMFWLLESINRGKEYRILLPVTANIELRPQRRVLGDDSPPSPSSAAASPTVAPQSSFFAVASTPLTLDIQKASSSSSTKVIDQREIVIMMNSLIDFSSETGYLNGRLGRFKELFTEMVSNAGRINESKHQELLLLHSALTQTLSRLRSPQPQTETTTAPAAPSTTATM